MSAFLLTVVVFVLWVATFNHQKFGPPEQKTEETQQQEASSPLSTLGDLFSGNPQTGTDSETQSSGDDEILIIEDFGSEPLDF